MDTNSLSTRYLDDESASFVVVGVDDEVAAQIENVAFRQRQSEPKTLGEVILLGKEGEHTVEVSLGDAIAGVYNGEPYVFFVNGDAYRHVLAI